MSERSVAYIKDKRRNQAVEAVLIDGLTKEEIAIAQASWEPILKSSTVRKEHEHWDWNKKYQLVAAAPIAYRLFGLGAENEIQGLMRVLTTGRFSVIEKGKPLIYVDYVATAPWNSPDVVENIRFSGVGKVLVRTACQLSEEEGFRGRIGLHSLPQSESWYRDVCRMTELGPDRSYLNLVYFEMTPEQTAQYIEG